MCIIITLVNNILWILNILRVYVFLYYVFTRILNNFSEVLIKDLSNDMLLFYYIVTSRDINNHGISVTQKFLVREVRSGSTEWEMEYL